MGNAGGRPRKYREPTVPITIRFPASIAKALKAMDSGKQDYVVNVVRQDLETTGNRVYLLTQRRQRLEDELEDATRELERVQDGNQAYQATIDEAIQRARDAVRAQLTAVEDLDAGEQRARLEHLRRNHPLLERLPDAEWDELLATEGVSP